jgi:SAM-dependent methyltransferase
MKHSAAATPGVKRVRCGPEPLRAGPPLVMSTYGSIDWLEAAYRRTSSDPWGLQWRPTQLFRYGRMVSELLRCVSERPCATDCVVDVGCATGDFTSLLARALPRSAHRRVLGLDLSPTAVERAAAKFPELEFHAGALRELPRHLERPADILCCLEVLYYLPEEERTAAMEIFSASMGPGGVLLVSSMIGQPPYMDHHRLCELVGRRFSIVTASCLQLWPLVALEKGLLRLPWVRPRFDPRQFLPGRRGFRVVQQLGELCGATFGNHALSHAYVLAVKA